MVFCLESCGEDCTVLDLPLVASVEPVFAALAQVFSPGTTFLFPFLLSSMTCLFVIWTLLSSNLFSLGAVFMMLEFTVFVNFSLLPKLLHNNTC